MTPGANGGAPWAPLASSLDQLVAIVLTREDSICSVIFGPSSEAATGRPAPSRQVVEPFCQMRFEVVTLSFIVRSQ